MIVFYTAVYMSQKLFNQQGPTYATLSVIKLDHGAVGYVQSHVEACTV